MERWGASGVLERTFRGFEALPAPEGTGWWTVLRVAHDAPLTVAHAAYLRLRRTAHPDHGGSADAFNAVQQAWEEAQKARIREQDNDIPTHGGESS